MTQQNHTTHSTQHTTHNAQHTAHSTHSLPWRAGDNVVGEDREEQDGVLQDAVQGDVECCRHVGDGLQQAGSSRQAGRQAGREAGRQGGVECHHPQATDYHSNPKFKPGNNCMFSLYR